MTHHLTAKHDAIAGFNDGEKGHINTRKNTAINCTWWVAVTIVGVEHHTYRKNSMCDRAVAAGILYTVCGSRMISGMQTVSGSRTCMRPPERGISDQNFRLM